jgi:hypothetical protein
MGYLAGRVRRWSYATVVVKSLVFICVNYDNNNIMVFILTTMSNKTHPKEKGGNNNQF